MKSQIGNQVIVSTNNMKTYRIPKLAMRISCMYIFAMFTIASFFVTVKPVSADVMPKTSAAKLPCWHGFNLLEKFTVKGNKSFVEEDFKLIAQWGFNFVRLPLDYRCYTREGDWKEFDEKNLKEIDEAVAWGRKYGIHVCINLHRAPGYCVNLPNESSDLWTDTGTQEVCALHWAMFAKRYKNIPNEYLSFNLLNEPSAIDKKTYCNVVKKLVEAIRREDPKRLIIADGLRWGTEPVNELAPLGIAQATRGYAPITLTHYKASWMNGSDKWPVPVWPVYKSATPYIYGPAKKEYQSALVIKGRFKKEADLKIKINTVSARSKLVIKADGITIFEKLFEPGPGNGEWKEAVYKKEWNIYQNVYDKYYSVIIPSNTEEITIENSDGDWFTFSEIRIKPVDDTGEKEAVLSAGAAEWGIPQETYYFTKGGEIQPADKTPSCDKAWLWKHNILPWSALGSQGVGTIVGEWGVYRYTPHKVTLDWMKSCLENWKQAGFGWALWNFRGSFGILDSGRDDVKYEDFNGHKLDREMLNLLQQY